MPILKSTYVKKSACIEMSQVRLQHGKGSFSVFTVLAFAIFTLFFLQAAGMAFIQLGIPIWLAIIIIPGSLLGSVINIPLYTVKSDTAPCIEDSHVFYWGVSYQVFHPECPGETRISINLGGAVIPVAVSAYLILMNLIAMIQFAVAITIVTLVVHRVARIVAIAPGSYNGYAIAYVCGTLGTLIGADLLNLNKLSQLRTGEASIGGAGTWDGVFLTGILAVFLL
jgi:uncharacterized membrane protein